MQFTISLEAFVRLTSLIATALVASTVGCRAHSTVGNAPSHDDAIERESGELLRESNNADMIRAALRCGELIVGGVRLQASDRWRESLDSLSQAEMLCTHPATTIAIARAELTLDSGPPTGWFESTPSARAWRAYQEYLVRAPGAADSSTVAALIDQIGRATAERSRSGSKSGLSTFLGATYALHMQDSKRRLESYVLYPNKKFWGITVDCYGMDRRCKIDGPIPIRSWGGIPLRDAPDFDMEIVGYELHPATVAALGQLNKRIRQFAESTTRTVPFTAIFGTVPIDANVAVVFFPWGVWKRGLSKGSQGMQSVAFKFAAARQAEAENDGWAPDARFWIAMRTTLSP